MKKKSCWKGYEKRGTKQKGGRTVNNCVKKEPREKEIALSPSGAGFFSSEH